MNKGDPNPALPLLSIQGVSIHYDGVNALRPSSFDVYEGEFVTLLGPSGSGKTSLLRAIAGFLVPTSGVISLRGRVLGSTPPYLRNIGLVFQNYALFPHMSVHDNIAFGLKQRRIETAEMENRIDEVMRYVRLEGLGKRRTFELSGGQQQRVAIARALAVRPDLLLLDEPMSNLDAQLRMSMQSELRGMLRDIGVTAIYVTHNQEEALSMSDRVVVMANGEIRQIDTPTKIYEHPADTFVANFVGVSNIFRANVISSDHQLSLARAEPGFMLQVPAPVDKDELILMIRPEQIHLQPAGDLPGINETNGVVREISYLGDRQLVRIAVGQQDFQVSQVPGEVTARPGQTVKLSWSAKAAVVVRPG